MSRADKLNQLVAETLHEREAIYAPKQGRRYSQLAVTMQMYDAAMVLLPDDIEPAAAGAVFHLCDKLARGIELALEGGWHGDNVLDLGGYLAVLAASRLTTMRDGSEEVLPEEAVLGHRLLDEGTSTVNVRGEDYEDKGSTLPVARKVVSEYGWRFAEHAYLPDGTKVTLSFTEDCVAYVPGHISFDEVVTSQCQGRQTVCKADMLLRYNPQIINPAL